MKQAQPLLVSHDLLNELGTLAAPSMLAAALRTAFVELGDAYPQALTLCGYRAEFKEGARAGDSIQLALEEAAPTLPGDREFDVYFSKGDNFGRVGKWRLTFGPCAGGRLPPYSIAQAEADGRTDAALWRPEPAVATGNLVRDGQALLWLAGQSARAYMKRLDAEFAADAGVELADELETRNYGGILVVVHMAGWPAAGETLHSALQYQLPLRRQSADKKMVFNGVLTTERADGTYLLGTFRFTVARIDARRMSIYPDGSTERK